MVYVGKKKKRAFWHTNPYRCPLHPCAACAAFSQGIHRACKHLTHSSTIVGEKPSVSHCPIDRTQTSPLGDENCSPWCATHLGSLPPQQQRQMDTQPGFFEGTLSNPCGSSAINHSGYKHTPRQQERSFQHSPGRLLSAKASADVPCPTAGQPESQGQERARSWCGTGAAPRPNPHTQPSPDTWGFGQAALEGARFLAECRDMRWLSPPAALAAAKGCEGTLPVPLSLPSEPEASDSATPLLNFKHPPQEGMSCTLQDPSEVTRLQSTAGLPSPPGCLPLTPSSSYEADTVVTPPSHSQKAP